MFKKIIYGTLGFGTGSFLLFNSIICLYRFYTNYSQIMGPKEWLISFIITFLSGTLLIIFTQKIIRQ